MAFHRVLGWKKDFGSLFVIYRILIVTVCINNKFFPHEGSIVFPFPLSLSLALALAPVCSDEVYWLANSYSWEVPCYLWSSVVIKVYYARSSSIWVFLFVPSRSNYFFLSVLLPQVQAVLLLLGGCEYTPGMQGVEGAYQNSRVCINYATDMFHCFYLSSCLVVILKTSCWILIRVWWTILGAVMIPGEWNPWTGFVWKGKGGALRRKSDIMFVKKLQWGNPFG